MQALDTLPNREGFKFRGIRKDGQRHMNCRTKHLPGVGMFIVATGRYVYEDVSPELNGWEPHPAKLRRAEKNISGNDPSQDRAKGCAQESTGIAGKAEAASPRVAARGVLSNEKRESV